MLNSARLLALFVIMIFCTCFYMIMYSVDRTEKLIMMDSLLNLQSDAVIADGDTNIPHIRDHHHEGVLLGHNEDTITGTTSILERPSQQRQMEFMLITTRILILILLLILLATKLLKSTFYNFHFTSTKIFYTMPIS